MSSRLRWCTLALVVTAGCGASARDVPATSAVVTPRPHPAPAPEAIATRCPASVDARALLDRHARAYGTAEATRAALPRTTRFDETRGKSKGGAELVLDRAAHRWEARIGGVHHASGVDGDGAWTLGVSGVPLRLRPEEAPAVAFEAWLARREYLAAFDAKRDAVSCSEADGRAHARVRYALDALGAPELAFDLASAALISATSSSADGRRSTTTYEAWSEVDAGVRWPAAFTSRDASGNEASFRATEATAGLACRGMRAPPASPAACLTTPASALAVGWPASGVVTVPMKHYLGQITLRVRVHDRDAWALLDSGANLTVVDATTPAGAAFVSGLELTGSAAAQRIRAGLGELPALQIGALTFTHLPAASVPIPGLDALGNRRPEIIVGFSAFAAAAVRIDYAKSELTFARSADALPRRASVATVPLRVLDGKPVADARVDDVTGSFLVDTGSSGGVDLNRHFADAHGFPGARQSLELAARMGAGEEETAAVLFRLARSQLGPIAHPDRVVQIDDAPEPGVLAGLVGNEVLSRCAAVVFDVSARSLSFEPPCDRASPEAKAGWRLAKKESAAWKGRPWVIEKLVPTSSAARAGLEVGDRLLTVGGVPVDEDLSRLQPVVSRAEGAKLTVELARGEERRKTTMVLRRLLAP